MTRVNVIIVDLVSLVGVVVIVESKRARMSILMTRGQKSTTGATCKSSALFQEVVIVVIV